MLEKIQNKCLKFIFNIKGAVSFSKLWERRKESRHRLFCKGQQNNSMTCYHFDLKCLVTRIARDKLLICTFSLKISTYFNSYFSKN